MKIVGIGDLAVDYYFVDGKFEGLCGGMTSFNIISHLAKDFDTYALGSCGNDFEGDIATDSLKSLGVNTDYIVRNNCQTRCFYISIDTKDYSIKSKKSCPICGNRKWYDKTLVSDKIPAILLRKDTIAIMDTINKVNLSIADKIKKSGGKVLIDIGQIGNFKYLTLSELKEKLYDRFDIVQLNERVSNFLLKKFKITSTHELNNIFNSKIITITHGKKGATFIYNNKSVFFETREIAKEIDPSGAGDSFYSEIIREYIKSKFIVNDDIIKRAYENASKLSSKVVQTLGARGTLQKFYDKAQINDLCICGSNNLDETKKTIKKKSLVNINNLEDRVNRALESNAYDELKEQLKNRDKDKSALFIGAGGSRAAAYFASRVINEIYGTTCVFLNPRDVLYRNNKNIDNIYAFSYSGASPDICYIVNKTEIKSTIISKKKKEKICKKYTNNDINYISYGNAEYSSGRERGFLSFEGAVAPAALFAKLYYETLSKDIPFEEFMSNRFDYWKDFFDRYFRDNKKILSQVLDKKNLIDIFYGDYTTTAALDLESKIVESGVYRIESHEKKNFSHGRFITNEHYTADTIIYLCTNNKNKYETKLKEYLINNTNNIIEINSEYSGIIGEFDLLIAVQFFVANISKLLNIDISKPDYTEDSMKIYRYEGEL